ncbi:NADH-quinone oxidoreductase subunit C [Knoellia subterranea]|uniref:NADH dehydrogenase n=1 Tax=Knoellia subterranea KCTC 19937 TaxID=1385521 RepID=A0A0A0JRM6_9MICO|nr:NADH-quinone oxidoreductase subunit C [Knoellia subterranea]KGN38256.1 NADH dehydrogenase [Knoellia subterranea KCTC 19937]
MSTDELHDVAPGEWHEAVSAAQATGFTFFDWLSAVDRTYDEANPGYDVVLRAIALNRRDPVVGEGVEGLHAMRITTRVPEGVALASVTDVYAGAAWHERETHEMFGVEFDGFDDGSGSGLRPLLLPEGFEGTPLRKSFVLAARASKTWPGGKEPGEGHDSAKSPSRRRVQAPGVPDPEWGPR